MPFRGIVPLAAAVAAVVAALLVAVAPARAQPAPRIVDLADLSTSHDLRRVWGSTGSGASGLPVAGPGDIDGDGILDVAFGAMRSDPGGRARAGIVYVVFGNGPLPGSVDTGLSNPGVLEVWGDDVQETAGSEVWMEDVTGDGLVDVLIARQNHTPDSPVQTLGAGALTILVGDAILRSYAASNTPIDLRTPPLDVSVFTILGRTELARLGIWMRTGDIDGDTVADIVIGADQEDAPGESHRGAAYVIRGGSHLAAGGPLDLRDFPALPAPFDGHIAKLNPPALPAPIHFHFGATCQIADLDGNGRGEVLVAAALDRAGAALPVLGVPAGSNDSSGGSADGTLYIAWDDNFTQNPWPSGYTFDIDLAPGSFTVLDGGALNIRFGEEIGQTADFDGDGSKDLFVGDIIADLSASGRSQAGSGHVVYGAAGLRNLETDWDALAALGFTTAEFWGAAFGDILADTAAVGDFDGDGATDLVLGVPHGDPVGRANAGIVHVLFGGEIWPTINDMFAPPAALRRSEFWGALGSGAAAGSGDMLMYSASAGDYDGDGRDDLVLNEMTGDGLQPGTIDVGNLIVLPGGLASNPVPIPLLPGAGGAGLLSVLAAALVVARRRVTRRA